MQHHFKHVKKVPMVKFPGKSNQISHSGQVLETCQVLKCKLDLTDFQNLSGRKRTTVFTY